MARPDEGAWTVNADNNADLADIVRHLASIQQAIELSPRVAYSTFETIQTLTAEILKKAKANQCRSSKHIETLEKDATQSKRRIACLDQEVEQLKQQNTGLIQQLEESREQTLDTVDEYEEGKDKPLLAALSRELLTTCTDLRAALVEEKAKNEELKKTG